MLSEGSKRGLGAGAEDGGNEAGKIGREEQEYTGGYDRLEGKEVDLHTLAIELDILDT